ncbi:MAG: hypothetical protein O2794_01825 [bacterium]|nr:hypothetical protein [bacterium]
MKEFIFIFRGGKLDEVYPIEAQKIAYRRRWGVWIRHLIDGGFFTSGLPISEATGMFDETQDDIEPEDQLDFIKNTKGYIFVVAPSMSEAREIALGCPIHEVGGEVVIRET